MLKFLQKLRNKRKEKIANQILFDLKKGKTLDNGCGPNGSFDYKKTKNSVIKCDLITGIDSHNLPYKKEFDNVVMAGLINYVASPSKVIEEAKRVLNKDGIIILTIFNPNHFIIKYKPMIFEKQHWSLAGIKQLLNYHKLKVIKFKDFGLVWYFVLKTN